jgi:exodeoxyribonuclease V alpha subunit
MPSVTSIDEQQTTQTTSKPSTMRGVVENVVYESPEFTVADFLPEGQLLPVRIVGPLPGVAAGASLLVSGSWTVHPQYGEQFRVENFAPEAPRTEEGLARYLGSGLIPGIGPALAGRIVERFGLEALTVMDNNVERLLEVPGIGPRKLEGIKEAWAEQRKIAALMEALMGLGVGPALAARIHKEYGDEAEETVRLTPYKLTEIRGVGFLTADRIARNIGVPHDAPARIEAGVVHVLGEMAGEGHVCAPRDVLAGAAVELLEVDGDPVQEAIGRLARSRRLRLEQGIVVEDEGEPVEALYLPWLHRAEAGVAERLLALAAEPPALDVDVDDLPGEVAGVTLSDKQLEAVRLALTRKVAVVTGGPGTGKTTIIHSILELLADADLLYGEMATPRVALAAPTGRAARRMTELCDFPAGTVHRLLGAGGPGRFEHDEYNPLMVDVLILDETSMLDVALFHALLKALPRHAHLVMVGDADQLPSVGPGNVMRDLVESGAVPAVRLDTIFRQAEASSIVSNAHRVNRGEAPLFPQDDDADGRRDFYFFSADDQEAAAELVVDLVARRIPDKFGHDPGDVQVLSPLRKRGEAASDALNRRLQAALNPPRDGASECRVGQRLFRVGDRVLQTRNDYTRYVFNGELGTVAGIDTERKELTAFFDDRMAVYAFDELGNLDLAYALSVHKSQGSEYPVVVILVLTSHYVMLRRNLFYTGITRAREMVVIVGQRRAMHIAVSEGRRERRFSGLRWRLFVNSDFVVQNTTATSAAES